MFRFVICGRGSCTVGRQRVYPRTKEMLEQLELLPEVELGGLRWFTKLGFRHLGDESSSFSPAVHQPNQCLVPGAPVPTPTPKSFNSPRTRFWTRFSTSRSICTEPPLTITQYPFFQRWSNMVRQTPFPSLLLLTETNSSLPPG